MKKHSKSVTRTFSFCGQAGNFPHVYTITSDSDYRFDRYRVNQSRERRRLSTEHHIDSLQLT